jgi:hypothetical protein
MASVLPFRPRGLAPPSATCSAIPRAYENIGADALYSCSQLALRHGTTEIVMRANGAQLEEN